MKENLIFSYSPDKTGRPNVCWNALKMPVFSLNCCLLCFSKEEILSTLASKNKVADESTTIHLVKGGNLKKVPPFLEHSNKCLALLILPGL